MLNINTHASFQHGLKKIRNVVWSSGCSERSTPLLQTEKGQVEWRYWREALEHVEWDIAQPYKVYPMLSHVHTSPPPKKKRKKEMRNHLAEEVLSDQMLYPMMVCFSLYY